MLCGEQAEEGSETGVWPQGSYEWEDTVLEAEGYVGRRVMDDGSLGSGSGGQEAGKLPSLILPDSSIYPTQCPALRALPQVVATSPSPKSNPATRIPIPLGSMYPDNSLALLGRG